MGVPGLGLSQNSWLGDRLTGSRVFGVTVHQVLLRTTGDDHLHPRVWNTRRASLVDLSNKGCAFNRVTGARVTWVCRTGSRWRDVGLSAQTPTCRREKTISIAVVSGELRDYPNSTW